MQEGEDWKHKALRIVPPWLVLGIYRDLIAQISWIHLKSFSIQKIRKEIMEEAGDVDSIDRYDVQQRRLPKVLPKAVDVLAQAGLLIRRNNGLLSKSEDYYEFFDLVKKTQVSVEKATRWGAYYLLARGRPSFSIDELASLMVPPEDEIIEVMKKLAIREKGEYFRVLRQDNDRWTITVEPRYRSRPPSAVKDIYEKLLNAISSIARTGTSQIDTSSVIECVHSSDINSLERSLSRLHFRNKNGLWNLPSEMPSTEKLVDNIESSTRLPVGQAISNCWTLLDMESLSVTEIAETMGMDKSTVSRTLKKLSDEKAIVRSQQKGRYGEEYYVTNCEKCLAGKDKEQCRKDSISQIKMMLTGLQLGTSEVDWGKIANQTLNRVKYSLQQMKTEKPTKEGTQEFALVWDALLRGKILKIIDQMEVRFTRMTGEKGWSNEELVYEMVDEKSTTLPLMYRLGVMHTLRSPQVKHGLELLSREKYLAKRSLRKS